MSAKKSSARKSKSSGAKKKKKSSASKKKASRKSPAKKSSRKTARNSKRSTKAKAKAKAKAKKKVKKVKKVSSRTSKKPATKKKSPSKTAKKAPAKPARAKKSTRTSRSAKTKKAAGAAAPARTRQIAKTTKTARARKTAEAARGKPEPTKPRPRSPHTKRQLERIRQALVVKKSTLTNHIQSELSELETGDKHHLADLEEMASDTTDTDSTVGIIEAGTNTLEQIDRALKTLDAGTYGICEDCLDPIPIERLQALPFATLCIRCKSKREATAPRW